MARRSISTACLALLVASASAQAFGRFGYTEQIDVPGFLVERRGFKVRQDQADWFNFEEQSKIWRPLATDDYSQTVQLSGIGRAAGKAKFDLNGTGFSMYFRHGIGFRLTSNQAPFLTWADGSVGPGVPTPKSRWILISFRDSQPCVLLAVQGSPEAFQVIGKPGDWRIRSTSDFQGWVRITAPLGLERSATNTAASLGSLSAKVKSVAQYFVDPVPRLVKTDIVDEPTAVTVTWTFDKPNAVLPLPAVLANLGGYPLRLLSSATRIDSTDPAGPVSVVNGNVLKVRLPVRRIPAGRSLALGQVTPDPIATVSPIDVPSVAELALANLAAGRDTLTKETAEETLAKYLGEANYDAEPATGQKLPYLADGTGIDLAAAHALLMQSTISTVKATSEPNSLLTSVMWRRDWRTWTVWTKDPEVGRRAASLAATAAVLCPEPERRADGAMLEAGLSAQEGLRIWQGRNGFVQLPKPMAAPFDGLRRALFFYLKQTPRDEAYVRSLLSEIRVYGEVAVHAVVKENSIALNWESPDGKPMTIILASAYPLAAAATENLTSLTVEEALGFTVLRCVPESRGRCGVSIHVPEWAAPLPPYVDPPRHG